MSDNDGTNRDGADSDGTKTEGPDGEGPSSDSTARQARRRSAYRRARRVLARPGFKDTVAERLEWLQREAPKVYDLDQSPDLYGDRVVETLEERVAELLGTEAAAFFPTGTMAQQVALRCWAGRTGNPTVALHPLAHPEVHEREAFREVSGLRTVHPTTEPRMPDAAEIRDFPEPFGALMLELPLREPGFLLPSWEELCEVVEAARERDAVVHFDGARLWESATHFGRPLAEIAGLADSVYVSFYKSLGAFGGAALAGPRTLVDEAKTWRHRYGGLMFQQFPTVLSALVGLERQLPRLPEYVAHARVVAEALREGFADAGLPWARVHPEPPHTHQFQVLLPYEAEVLEDAATEQAEETGVYLFPGTWSGRAPGVSCAEVTVDAAGLEWSAEDVRVAASDFARRVR